MSGSVSCYTTDNCVYFQWHDRTHIAECRCTTYTEQWQTKEHQHRRAWLQALVVTTSSMCYEGAVSGMVGGSTPLLPARPKLMLALRPALELLRMPFMPEHKEEIMHEIAQPLLALC